MTDMTGTEGMGGTRGTTMTVEEGTITTAEEAKNGIRSEERKRSLTAWAF
jgi:hypothetical protein